MPFNISGRSYSFPRLYIPQLPSLPPLVPLLINDVKDEEKEEWVSLRIQEQICGKTWGCGQSADTLRGRICTRWINVWAWLVLFEEYLCAMHDWFLCWLIILASLNGRGFVPRRERAAAWRFLHLGLRSWNTKREMNGGGGGAERFVMPSKQAIWKSEQPSL